MMRKSSATLIAVGILMSGCASMGEQQTQVPRAAHVDATRYMGPWFIIEAIPLSVEEGAYDPVETYTRNPDGSIATVFQFRKGGFDGTLETKPIISHIQPDTGSAEWCVQTIWPLQQQYVISFIESDYSSAIVGRDARDHVWVLSRKPQLPAATLEEYKHIIESQGYDVTKLISFPQNGQPPWK